MVHEIKSLIEIYDGKKIDRAKQETEEEKEEKTGEIVDKREAWLEFWRQW